MPNQIKAQDWVARAAALAVTVLLGAWGPVTTVDPRSALEGRGLEAAVNLYGPYDARLELSGRTAYVWRRSLVAGGRPQACELRAEVGYRDVIRLTRLEGAQGACQAFLIRYASNSEARREAAAPPAQAVKKTARQANWRPVGAPGPVQTASAATPQSE